MRSEARGVKRQQSGLTLLQFERIIIINNIYCIINLMYFFCTIQSREDTEIGYLRGIHRSTVYSG